MLLLLLLLLLDDLELALFDVIGVEGSVFTGDVAEALNAVVLFADSGAVETVVETLVVFGVMVVGNAVEGEGRMEALWVGDRGFRAGLTAY